MNSALKIECSDSLQSIVRHYTVCVQGWLPVPEYAQKKGLLLEQKMTALQRNSVFTAIFILFDTAQVKNDLRFQRVFFDRKAAMPSRLFYRH
jgi:hypothetical protein